MESVELVGRLLVSLAVVIGLIWLIAKRARGSRRGKVRAEKLIDVIGRQQLSRSSSVAVVRVHDRALIVGVTDSAVTVLGEMGLAEVEDFQAATQPASRAASGRADSGRSTSGRAASGRAASSGGADPTHHSAHGSTHHSALLREMQSRTTASRPNASPRGERPSRGYDDLPGRSPGSGDTTGAADPQGIVIPDDVLDAAARERLEPYQPSSGALAGSALSPTTWKQTINALREMTVRKG